MNSLDIYIVVLIGLGIYKGFSKGLIMAILSVIAWIIGWMLASRLSSTLVSYLGDNISHSRLGPFIAFIAVFLLVGFAIVWIGRRMENLLQAVMLGWVNRIAGASIYALGAALIASGTLWMMDSLHLLDKQEETSKLYDIIQPLAPEFADNMDDIFPIIKNSYNTIQNTVNAAIPTNPKEI